MKLYIRNIQELKTSTQKLIIKKQHFEWLKLCFEDLLDYVNMFAFWWPKNTVLRRRWGWAGCLKGVEVLLTRPIRFMLSSLAELLWDRVSN
jgi:hypothetical protein